MPVAERGPGARGQGDTDAVTAAGSPHGTITDSDRSFDGRSRVADYERTGGIEGAVAADAHRVYDGLTPSPAGRGPAGLYAADRHQQ